MLWLAWCTMWTAALVPFTPYAQWQEQISAAVERAHAPAEKRAAPAPARPLMTLGWVSEDDAPHF